MFDKMRAPIKITKPYIKTFFNSELIEEVFCVREYAFDSTILKDILLERLHDGKIELKLNTKALHVSKGEEGILVTLQDNSIIESKKGI